MKMRFFFPRRIKTESDKKKEVRLFLSVWLTLYVLVCVCASSAGCWAVVSLVRIVKNNQSDWVSAFQWRRYVLRKKRSHEELDVNIAFITNEAHCPSPASGPLSRTNSHSRPSCRSTSHSLMLADMHPASLFYHFLFRSMVVMSTIA